MNRTQAVLRVSSPALLCPLPSSANKSESAWRNMLHLSTPRHVNTAEHAGQHSICKPQYQPSVPRQLLHRRLQHRLQAVSNSASDSPAGSLVQPHTLGIRALALVAGLMLGASAPALAKQVAIEDVENPAMQAGCQPRLHCLSLCLVHCLLVLKSLRRRAVRLGGCQREAL